MKFTVRFLSALPFLFITCLYYKFHDPDENCYGLADNMINFVFYAFLVLTGCIALYGTLHRRLHETVSVEPVTFSIIIFSILVLVYNSTLRGHTKGAKWIYADNKNSEHPFSNQSLTLKKNGNFTIALDEADFGCSISGKYKKQGDTIFLDKKAVLKTSETITTIYLMNFNKLIPLFDTTGKTTFCISER